MDEFVTDIKPIDLQDGEEVSEETFIELSYGRGDDEDE